MTLRVAARWLPLTGLVVFAGVLSQVDAATLRRSWEGAMPSWVALAAALWLLELGLRTWVLRRVAGSWGAALPPFASMQATWFGYSLGTVTPGKLGDFAKAGAVGRATGASGRSVLAILLHERGLLAVGLGIWCLGGLAVAAGWSAGATLVLVLAAPLALVALSRSACLVRWTGGPALCVAVLAWGCVFLRGWFLATALGLGVPLVPFLLLTALAAAAECLPLSFMGFGVRELGLAVMLAPFGVTLEQAVALSIFGLALGLVLAMPGLVLHYARPAVDRA